MARPGELLDQGIKAYTRGLFDEAERCWREALEADPANERAQAYLRQLGERMKRLGTPPPGAAGEPATVPPAPGPGNGNAETAAAAAPAQPAEDFAPSPWDHGPATATTIVLDPDGGLDLSAIAEKSDLRPLVPEPGKGTGAPPAQPRSDVEVWMEGARELFALGDFSGSLEMIEKILKVDPNHKEAWEYLRQNESTLIAMYESKLGSLSNVPRLAIKPEEVMWLNLDHRAGFLLAQIDGIVNYEELFALSGLPRLDTAKILATLLNDGVIR
jgi:tetratricopeptide (TPR) repeat protein